MRAARYAPIIPAMNALMHWLAGTSGYELVAIVCCLIVIEELGVPMPWAPGDLLLVMTGVAITVDHLNPVAVAGATYFAAIVGAVGGREIFMRIGAAALPRVAAFLHVSQHVDGLAARLRRGGAPAVFFARITPGLRVVTNEVSGLVALPRKTFLRGLLPAVAVYEAVFLGLGLTLGPTAWSTIERYAQNPRVMVLIVAGLGALLFASHLILRPRGPRLGRLIVS